MFDVEVLSVDVYRHESFYDVCTRKMKLLMTLMFMQWEYKALKFRDTNLISCLQQENITTNTTSMLMRWNIKR